MAVPVAFSCSSPEAHEGNDPTPTVGGEGGEGGSTAAVAGGAADGGSAGQDGAPPAYNDPLGFNPSNAGLAGGEAESVGDVMVAESECVIDTDEGTWSCVDPASYVHRFERLPDGSGYAVFVVKSLQILPDAGLITSGSRPLLLIALEDMLIEGSILLPPGSAGGELNAKPYMTGSGAGGGPMGSETVAGGGASFCGSGGRGGAKPGASSGDPGSAYGSQELAPLIAGSAGGSGEPADSGQGGGAVQLVAGGTFTLLASGAVTAVGGLGLAGERASGGGSGGGILIEAATVMIRGTLDASGGDGGGESGGAGSAGADVDGSAGQLDANGEPGGGGGGAGRIRINTSNGEADVTGANVSPPLDTSCASVGTID